MADPQSEFCELCQRRNPVGVTNGMTKCRVCGNNLHRTHRLKGYNQMSVDDKGRPAKGYGPPPPQTGNI